MLSYEEAEACVLRAAEPLGAERIFVGEADGRVLAEDVRAPFSLPLFDYSAMDGYALRLGDLNGDRALPLSGSSTAGSEPQALQPGSAMRIYTGGPLPSGADTVVMQEKVALEDSGNRLVINDSPQLGQHIRRRAEDLQEGALAVRRGSRLTPGKVALVAALDQANLLCTRRPRVTILCSGDELRSPGAASKRPGSIVESNGYFVANVARRLGAHAVLAPFVGDDPRSTDDAVEQALRASDLLVTIGGVSVSDRDLVRPALEHAGVLTEFYKVAIKPGKPVVFGRRGATLVLGLPGNPASAALTFLLFGVPALRRLLGETEERWRTLELPVVGQAKSMAGRTDFARVTVEDGKAHLATNQASGAVTSFADATALARIDAERTQINSGDVVRVIDLRQLGLV